MIRLILAILFHATLFTINPDSAAAVQHLTVAGDQHACEGAGDEASAPLATGSTVVAVGDLGTRECYDQAWGVHADRTLAVAGNHDYSDNPYFTTEFADLLADNAHPTYYTVTRGEWRLFVLDSNCDTKTYVSCDDQAAWLNRKLNQNPTRCAIAFFHHSAYSSAQSPNPAVRFTRLFNILARHNADVVVGAHRHGYERFARIAGLRQFVVGTAGSPRWAPWLEIHPQSQVRIAETWGVLQLQLYWDRYEWQFVAVDGSTLDSGSSRCSS